MTQEEKAKAYDEALKVLHKYDGANIMFSQSLKEEMFPELAESENEKIRKVLIDLVKCNERSGYKLLNNVSTSSMIAWLEAQGEQKFEQKFFINDKVVHKATGKIWTIHHYLKDTNSYYVEDNDGLLHHYIESELKLIEQKPAWSGEDLMPREEIINLLQKYGMDNEVAWLKSLRPQSHWKPSDKQMEAMQKALVDLCGKEEHNIITGLYYDLKKLREE